MANYDHPHHYHAYLLRCWQERSAQVPSSTTRRFSLEDPHTGIRLGFASLERLVAFLDNQTCDVCRATMEQVAIQDGAEPQSSRSIV